MTPEGMVTFMLVLLFLAIAFQLLLIVIDLVMVEKARNIINKFNELKKDIVKKPKVIPYGQSSNNK